MTRSAGMFTALLVLAGLSPGGAIAAYPHGGFRSHQYGSGAKSYWLFEPASPAPEKAPVIVFHHGWLAVNPGVYGAWIEHLTRRGSVVIFPRYHGDWTTPPADYLPNALAAVGDALDVLETAPGHVRPDRERFALIGHSAGGNLSALMAAAALEAGLPKPRALVIFMPGEVRPVAQPSLGMIPPDTLMVVAAGDQDALVGDARARRIHAGATAVPADRKVFLLYRTDRRGPVDIVADHLAPTAYLSKMDTGEGPFRFFQIGHAEVDILDRHGFWRVTDVTLDAAFAGMSLAEATGGGRLFHDLGRWSNGLAVTPPVVGNDLTAIPRVPSVSDARLLPSSPDDFFRSMIRNDRRAKPDRMVKMTGGK